MDSLSKKQKEYYLNAHSRWGIKCGAVRSGKTYVDVAAVIPENIIERKNKAGHAVIFGVSRDTIERNILQPMREIYGNHRVGVINSRNQAYMFGETVDCIGVEKANALGRVQGLSIKYAYGDEIAKWNEQVFAMIESRLDKPYSRFDGACNPEGPNHWFKKWLDKPDLDEYVQNYVLFDNPYLPDSFVDALCKEYEGTVYYDRYILGKWALAEGLIYPNYTQAVQKAPEEAFANGFESYSMSIDYGTQNAFAAILWGKWKNTWYGLKEYYWSGREKGIQKTDEEYGEDLDAFVQPVIDILKRRSRTQIDPFMAEEKLETIIDPSAASFIALLKKRQWCRVRKAVNDVADGIRETGSAMRDGIIKIDPDMKNWIKEAQGYAWDSKSGEDKPVKIDDHLMDATRYFVKTKHLMRKRYADISGLTGNFTN